jgi:hypothetical protein
MNSIPDTMTIPDALKELEAIRLKSPGADVWHQEVTAVLEAVARKAAEISGGDFTDGAGPDATCGCGEPITMYDDYWLHVINPELRGTDDHDAEPDGDYDEDDGDADLA